MITLSDDERKKFAEFLLQEANTEKILLGQMEKLRMPQHVTAASKQYCVACLVVHARLVNVEVQTISGSKNES